MTKLTLDSIDGGFSSNDLLNSNFQAIIDAFENTVSRDGSTPNSMSSDFNLDGNSLLNVPSPVNALDVANKDYVDTKLEQVSGLTATQIANIDIWGFSTEVNIEDPGVGSLRLNNVTPSLASSMVLSSRNQDVGNPDKSDWIAAWSSSTNSIKGQVTLTDSSNVATFIIMDITGTVVDNGTWLQVPVDIIASSGTFSDSTSMFVEFTRAGDISGSLLDGDKGDVTVSGSGATWEINDDTIDGDKLADESYTDILVDGGDMFIKDDAVGIDEIQEDVLAGYSDEVITESDSLIFADASDLNRTKKDTVQGIIDLIPTSTSATPTMQVFTSSGTWVKPEGCKSVEVTVIGGGGGGTGGTGNTSSFGIHCSATGGAGGISGSNNTPGTGVDGDLNLRGGYGQQFDNDTPGSRYGGAAPFIGVANTRLGIAAAPANSGQGGVTTTTNGYAGSGGGGALKFIDVTGISSEVVTVGAGGGSGTTAGGSGLVYVKEYY